MTMGNMDLTSAIVRLAEAVERLADRPVLEDVGITGDRPRRRLTMGSSFVRMALADGPRTWAEIVARGEQYGHHERTLRRARDEVAFVRKTSDGAWMWHLKED